MDQAFDPALGSARPRLPKRLLAVRGEGHLVERLRMGDEAAFEVLYDRYAAPLLSFCRHMLGRSDEAEDAVQQVFAAAHADLGRNQRKIDLKPWLYTIARNRCLSMLRARREHPDPEVESVTSGLQEQVQDRAELRQLVSDLGELPDNQRAALLLTELEDLPHAEVASILDCEPGQVKGLVFRAREGLIERRDARLAPCEDIRAELATARRGGLRRGRLRHHLAGCQGCSDYLEEVRRQRRMMALILPVVPGTGLKRAVLAAMGAGGGAGSAGGLTVAGGSVLGGVVAKVALVGVLAGGAGVAGERVLQERDSAPGRQAPAVAPAVKSAGVAPAIASPVPADAQSPAAAPRKRAPAGPGAAPGRRAKAPGGQDGARGRSRSDRGVSPPGLARRPAKTNPAGTPARPAIPPGRAKQAPASRRGSRPHAGHPRTRPAFRPRAQGAQAAQTVGRGPVRPAA